MNENSSKLKKIPVLSYLCCLLAVSVLFTGVTFSRYSSSTSGDVKTSLAQYVASYEIDDISSTAYTNAGYWLDSGAAQGTSRTVRFTLRNFEADKDGRAQRVSDVALNSTLRLYIPAELADNLVLQVVSVDSGNNTQTAVTPQYILGNFIYQTEINYGVEASDPAFGKYDYVIENGSRVLRTESDNTSLNTANFIDYNALASEDEALALSGAFEEGGTGDITVTASGESGNSLTITSTKEETQYSVGFRRGENETTDFQPQLFLDLEGEVTFYTIDLTLGDEQNFPAGIATQRTFVLYLTLAERITSLDYQVKWDPDTAGGVDPALRPGAKPQYDWLNDPAEGTSVYLFNGAKVIGYHYDLAASRRTYEGGAFTEDENADTTVRITKRYGIDGSTYDGTVTTAYSHVAAISESSVNYVHDIERYYTLSEDGSTLMLYPFENMPLGGTEVYGLCSRYYADLEAAGAIGDDGNIPVDALDGAGVFLIGFNGTADSPLYDSYAAQTSESGQKYKIFSSLSKGYHVQMTAVFVQASESGTAAAGEVSV